jgi:hypothetical protein
MVPASRARFFGLRVTLKNIARDLAGQESYEGGNHIERCAFMPARHRRSQEEQALFQAMRRNSNM